MDKPHRIETDACILVCDARRALFLRNVGTAFEPALEPVQVLAAPEIPAEMQRLSDRPGRRPDHVASGPGKGPRSAMEQPDPPRRQAAAFAETVAEALEATHREMKAAGILVAAPPEFLGDLRRSLPEAIRERIVLELAKDLTKLPVPSLGKALLAD